MSTFAVSGAVKTAGVSVIASLVVLAQIVTVVLVIGAIAWAVRPGARRALAAPAAVLERHGGAMAWFVAAAAMASSLWLSEHEHFVPCHLCLIQRAWMYPLVVVLAGVAAMRTRWVTWAAAVPAFVGLCVSIRHVYVEVHPEADTCRIGGTACSFKWIDEFGYVTIPVGAGTAFLLIVVLLTITGARQGSSSA